MEIEFAGSPRPTVGIEWELELVDRDSRELSQNASRVLAELGPDPDLARKAKHELFESTIEVITDPCATVAAAREDLAATTRAVDEAAARRGIGLICSGTHPTGEWFAQTVSPDSRYYRLLLDNQWLARRLLIFGVHVHVGVRDGARALSVVNALTAYLPHVLALSASSPYWMGEDTGLASARTKIFEGLATAGLPPRFDGWAEFERFMTTMRTAGTIKTIREVWWDIRPHPIFGTVELRIADGIPRLDEVAAHAALAQCLVHWIDGRLSAGEVPWVPEQWVARDNKWRAARHGLAAEIIVDDTGSPVALVDEIRALVEMLTPVAVELGCARELAGVVDILAAGSSTDRQRAVAVDHGGDLSAVVDHLLGEMKEGLSR